MIFLKNYFITTTEQVDVLSIIHEVRRTVLDSKISDGLVVVCVPEPGGALAILEPLPAIVEQFKEALRIFPGEGVETKNRRKEEISVGPRIVAAMLSRSLQIPLAGGKLVLGHREEPVFIDLERRIARREFYVQVVGDAPAEGAEGQAGARR
jgi:thiamine phosphate synthase YjbQ (UPF0047 family)